MGGKPVWGVWPASTHWVTSDSCMQEVQERLLCRALVGQESATKLIVQTDITCKFIRPVVKVSSRAITFRVEKVSLLPDCMLAFKGVTLKLAGSK